MAVLTMQQIRKGGASAAFVAASGGGDKVRAHPTSFLYVKNGGGAPITVTVDSKVPSNYGDDVNLVETVAAGAERPIPIGNPQRFAGPDGMADISYSGVTSVTVAAFYL